MGDCVICTNLYDLKGELVLERQELKLADDNHPMWKQIVEKAAGNLAKIKMTVEEYMQWQKGS